MLRLIKVPLCLTHLITPFLSPAATVLLLFSFFECLVKLQNPDVKPLSLFSFYFSDLSAFVPLVCFISLAMSLALFFIIPSARFFYSSSHAQGCERIGGHCVCVYKHVVCTYTGVDDSRNAFYLLLLCVCMAPEK